VDDAKAATSRHDCKREAVSCVIISRELIIRLRAASVSKPTAADASDEGADEELDVRDESKEGLWIFNAVTSFDQDDSKLSAINENDKQ
jgi:hypothetical protein